MMDPRLRGNDIVGCVNATKLCSGTRVETSLASSIMFFTIYKYACVKVKDKILIVSSLHNQL